MTTQPTAQTARPASPSAEAPQDPTYVGRSRPLTPTRLVDVALILEGTYPYAIGGVSTWVDGLLRGLPDVSFGIVHLYAGQVPTQSQFERPKNLVWQRDLALADDLDAFSPDALATLVPPARCIHALATGFAGQLAVAVSSRTGAPLLLTEHGIYWYEIQEGAPELECGLRLHGQDVSHGNPCASRALWVDRFKEIARDTYAAADTITTVCEANAELQRQLGAQNPVVIPNGVEVPDHAWPLDPGELDTMHASAQLSAEIRIGLVGRVTPIKDIHAFLRAASRVADQVPDAHFFVVGPTDDIDYASSVRALARRLNLADRFHLTGAQPAALWHRHLDIVVLTSRSEAQPIALLEAMAHRRPVVAPDVGGCRALVAGEGRAPAGIIVSHPPDDGGLGDIAPGIAEAILELAADAGLRVELGTEGHQRALKRSVQDVARRYRAIYNELVRGKVASSTAA